MIGGDRIAEDGQRPRIRDVARRAGLHAEPVEVWRLLDIRGIGRPVVDLADRRGDLLPERILLGEVAV